MSEIKPALSPEEWASEVVMRGDKYIARYLDYIEIGDDAIFGYDDQRGLSALAAVALHGQPFGFTWEDVDLLKLAGCIVGDRYGPVSEQERFDSLADRIAALLPPREP